MLAPQTAATLTAGVSTSPGINAPGRRQEDDHNIVAFAPQVGGRLSIADTLGADSPTLNRSQIHAVAYAADHTTALDTAQGGADDNTAQGGQLVATYQKVIRSGARDADGNLPQVWAHRDVAATLNLNDLGSESRAVEVVVQPVAVHENQRHEITLSETAGALKTGGGKPGQGYPAMFDGVIVRRLTPTECERLQGFPDGHTATSWGKAQADSPRYKQMGNAVAVPVFAWVARRIAAVHTERQEAV